MHSHISTTGNPSAEAVPFGWYAAYTRHQHEKSAAEILSNKGFEVLLPLYRSANQWKDRVQVVELPLFPSYLFVQLDLQRRIDVLRTPGVCWLVGTAGLPTPLPGHEIEALRRLVQHRDACQPYPFLNKGDRARVVKGPLTGIEGILVRFKNQTRVVLSVELLQQSAAVEVDASLLERVAPAKATPLAQLTESNCYA